ncbi:unnamed protein product [Callosobruchus maculatus]|uniref:Uncharacterized protein n=1 Tax=Callosobruchus maculatus TaxID=64391 RepID=A0A653DCJ4_CALMS|nr:unnamed protein product [Callosobruchus maculatus]
MSSVTFSSSSLTHILVRSEATEAVSQLLARSNNSSRGEAGEQSMRSASSAGIAHKGTPSAALRGDDVGVAMDSRGGGMSVVSIACSGIAIDSWVVLQQVLLQYLYIVVDEVLFIATFFLFYGFVFVSAVTEIVYVFGAYDVIVLCFRDDALLQKLPDNTDLGFVLRLAKVFQVFHHVESEVRSLAGVIQKHQEMMVGQNEVLQILSALYLLVNPDALEDKIGEDLVAEDGVDPLKIYLQLNSELQERSRLTIALSRSSSELRQCYIQGQCQSKGRAPGLALALNVTLT